MRIILFALLMVLAPATHQAHVLVSMEEEDAASLFKACGLAGVLPRNVFDQALVAAQKHDLKPNVIAIADMTRQLGEAPVHRCSECAPAVGHYVGGAWQELR